MEPRLRLALAILRPPATAANWPYATSSSRPVVQFLTDNTLGCIWYEMRQGDTQLKEQCEYLMAPSIPRAPSNAKPRSINAAYRSFFTLRTGFFLSSFQRWREEILLQEGRPTVFADLGYGVLDTAMVETAAYCLEVAE